MSRMALECYIFLRQWNGNVLNEKKNACSIVPTSSISTAMSVFKDRHKKAALKGNENIARVLCGPAMADGISGTCRYGRNGSKKKKLFLDLENKTKEICKACIILYVFLFASYSLMVRQESSRDIPRNCWPCEIAIHAWWFWMKDPGKTRGRPFEVDLSCILGEREREMVYRICQTEIIVKTKGLGDVTYCILVFFVFYKDPWVFFIWKIFFRYLIFDLRKSSFLSFLTFPINC